MEQPRARNDELHDELDAERRDPDDRTVDDEPVEAESVESQPVESEPKAPAVAMADRDMTREEDRAAVRAGEGEAVQSEPKAPTVATADRDMTREEEGAAEGTGEREVVSAPADRDGTPAAAPPSGPSLDSVDQPLELFSISDVEGYRRRWGALQAGFIDDPLAAAQQAESLVSELMQRMTDRHATLRKGLGESAGGVPDTESMRLTVRRYRAFFNSLVG